MYDSLQLNWIVISTEIQENKLSTDDMVERVPRHLFLLSYSNLTKNSACFRLGCDTVKNENNPFVFHLKIQKKTFTFIYLFIFF